MKLYLNLLSRIYSKIIHILFFGYKIFQSRWSSKQKIKILFSDKQDWKRAIRAGFQFTRHEIAFEELSSDKFKNYDLVLPLTIRDLMDVNDLHGPIVDNPIPIPNKDLIMLCDNKILFNQKLAKSVFSDLVPKMGGIIPYPYILKKNIGEWSENCHIISNAQQEQGFLNILNNPEYFTQEIITGPYEYATHILFKEQKNVCSLNIKYFFGKEMPIKGKDKEIYKRICHCPYLDIFSSILESIGFEGLCCINYKVYDNRPMILEINPRCGGSLNPYLFSFVERAIWQYRLHLNPANELITEQNTIPGGKREEYKYAEKLLHEPIHNTANISDWDKKVEDVLYFISLDCPIEF